MSEDRGTLRVFNAPNSIKMYFITLICVIAVNVSCIYPLANDLEALVHKIFLLGANISLFPAIKLLMTQSWGHQQDVGLITVKSLNVLKE